MTGHAGAELGGATPEPDGAVLRRGAKALLWSPDRSRVLVVKERHADGSVFWTLPGGGVRRDESLAGGLRRELVEEVGTRSIVQDAVTRFLYAHESRPDLVTAYTVFDCTPLSPPGSNRSQGILDHRWVDPETPPPATLPPVSRVLEETSQ